MEVISNFCRWEILVTWKGLGREKIDVFDFLENCGILVFRLHRFMDIGGLYGMPGNFLKISLKLFRPTAPNVFIGGLFKGSLRRHLRRLVEARWPHSHITFKKSLLILDTIPDRHCLLRCFIGRLMWLHVAVSGLLRRRHWSCHWHFDPPSVTVRFQWLRLTRGILCRHPTGISSRFLHSARNWSWPCSATLLPAESSIWWTVSHV